MAKLTGDTRSVNLAAKNALEKGLIQIRKRINPLSDVARRKEYQVLADQLTWLLLDVKKMREEVYAAQNQEVLPLDDTASKNAD